MIEMCTRIVPLSPAEVKDEAERCVDKALTNAREAVAWLNCAGNLPPGVESFWQEAAEPLRAACGRLMTLATALSIEEPPAPTQDTSRDVLNAAVIAAARQTCAWFPRDEDCPVGLMPLHAALEALDAHDQEAHDDA